MTNEFYKLILEQTLSGNIEKKTGIEILEKLKQIKCDTEDSIAIIGMSGRFPGADSVEDFWNIIEHGINLTTAFPRDRCAGMDAYKAAKKIKGEYLKGAYLHDIDKFDHKLYHLSKREASTMSPTQRIMLDVMYDALIDAGYPPNSICGARVGVYVGHSDDLRTTYSSLVREIQPHDSSLSVPGNLASIIPSQLSYFLNLKGPSVLIDTACSSFLTALHTACSGLINDCDMAVVGGIKICLLPVDDHIKLGMESDDGYTRTFNDNSNGTGIGEGAGALVLKPLKAALKCHDNIIAVIIGDAINQDGTTSGITVPNVESQANLLYEAWNKASVIPEDICYIEAHGTATKLGDPIEVEAISTAVSRFSNNKQFCGIGSVKSNIGHLYEGAGVASIIKSCLMLRYRCIPPTVLFDAPNRKIDFINSPIYVVDKARAVPEQKVMRVGISGFGFSGTNCHVVLEEYRTKADDCGGIFTISANDMDTLYQWAKLLSKVDYSAISMKGVYYTQNARRDHMKIRAVICAKNSSDLTAKLNKLSCGIQSDGIWFKKSDIKELDDIGLFADVVERYLSGESVDWSAQYADFDGHVVSLPVRPKHPVSCWFSQDMSEIKKSFLPSGGYYLIDDISDNEDTIICTTTLTSESNPIIHDHKVLGENVLPGTAYIEMLYEMMRKKMNGNILHINELELLQPIRAYKDHPTLIEMISKKNDDDSYYTKFFSTDVLSGRKEHHANAVLTIKERSDIVVDRVDDISVPADELFIPIDQCELTKGFIEFGERWSSLSIGLTEEKNNIRWARVSADKQFVHDFELLNLHPSVLDMAVNALALTCGEPHLPYKYNSIYIFDALDEITYTRFQLHNEANDQILRYDLLLFNSKGKLSMRADGYMVKKIKDLDDFTQRQKKLLHWSEWKRCSIPDNQSELLPKRALLINAWCDHQPALINAGNNIVSVMKESTVTSIRQFLDEHDNIWNNPEVIVISLGSNDDEVSQCTVMLLKLLKILNKHVASQLRVVVIGENVHRVVSQCKASAMVSCCFALLRSGLCENPYCFSVFMDIDGYSAFESYKNCLFSDQSDEYAVRNGQLYLEYIVPIKFWEKEPDFYGKNVLITGGFGGIGRQMARYFASKGVASISLLSRRRVDQLKPQDQADIEELSQEFADNNVKLIYLTGDVCDGTSLNSISQHLHKTVGIISVIVHCAGIAGSGVVASKTEQQMLSVLAPKIIGTNMLYDIFSDEAEYMYLMSSIASITAIPGQCDYSAANAYMDAFANSVYDGKCVVKTINWPSWSQVGMAKENDFVSDTFFRTISPEQAMQLFGSLIACNKTRIIAGEWNPMILDSAHSVILKRTVVERSLELINTSYDEKSHKQRVNVKLKGRADGEYTPSERKIAEIWAGVLEADEIDIYTNFNELGGNSILASYLIRELEHEYPGKFDITDVFSYPTVYKLSRYFDGVDEKNSSSNVDEAPNDPRNVEDILAQLAAGEISVEEASEYL